MESKLIKANEHGLLNSPPPFTLTGLQFECVMGSRSYGTSNESSDWDMVGWCIPPEPYLYPGLHGEIVGFGTQLPRFEQYQQQKVFIGDVEHDITIYGIAKYMNLCMQNNPNIIETLFSTDEKTNFETEIAKTLRANVHLFVHKGAWHRFKGYAYSQLDKMDKMDPKAGSKRKALVEKYGFDTKFGAHVVRLLFEIEELLNTGRITLDRNAKVISEVRHGEWSVDRIRKHFHAKEIELQGLYETTDLQWGPDEKGIKQLLIDILEQHYGYAGRF